MIKKYKEKASILQAVEFISAMGNAPEVADMLGAKSVSVDVGAKTATFGVGSKTYTVEEGQVVALDGTKVVVSSAEDFYAKYETV